MATLDTALDTALEPAAPSERRSAYSIAEASAATGASPDTLRYYERAGILPTIRRTDGGQRSYTPDDLGWITFVRRLRATGMTMQRIAEYTTMVQDGDGTIADRRGIIEDHRATVAAAIEELADVLTVLDRKIEHYEAAERGVDVGCSEQPLEFANQLT
jgi:DNA-binding transcriptional MerR regulator